MKHNFNGMKTNLLFGLALAAALGMTSCDNASKLAGNIEGVWQGETVSMSHGHPGHGDRDEDHGQRHGDRDAQGRIAPVEMTCAPTLTFTRDASTNGGNITISADYTISQGVATTVTTLPVKASVSGTATAQGTWTAKDDDEILVTLDPTKTDVRVNPTSLAISYGVVTDSPVSLLDSIKPNVAPGIESQVRSILESRISRLRKLDDVKFYTDNTMKLEIGHQKVTFTKR